MNILLTGFEPFGDFIKNSSYESIKVFNNTYRGKFKIIVKRLPVSYKKAGKQLERYIKKCKPAIGISFGMGTEYIQFETIALNINYSTRQDNDGLTITREKPIIAEGPPLYKTTLPYKKIEKAFKEKDIPLVKSFHAGTYLCNNIFYHLMHFAGKYKILIAGFIHVPPTMDCIKGNYNKPIIAMNTLREAIDLILKVCIQYYGEKTN